MNRNEQTIDIRAVVSRHRALAILRMLTSEELRGRTNDAVLSTLLDELALGGTQDVVRSELRRLEELNLMTIKVVNDRMVVELTERGSDVANGTARVEGIEPTGLVRLY